MFLKLIADREVAEFWRIHFPLHGVATRPVSARRGADVERHADTVAGVVTGTAHFREIPTGSEIARAPFRIGFETAASKHDRSGTQLADFALLAGADAFDAIAVEEQIDAAGRIAGFEAALFRSFGDQRHQPRTSTHRLHCKPAPNLEPALHLQRLAAVDPKKPHAFVAH